MLALVPPSSVRRWKARPFPADTSANPWAAFADNGVNAVVTQLTAANVPTRVDQQPGKKTLAMVAQFILPLLLLANLFGIFILLTRGGTGQVRDLFAFSRIGLDRS